MSPEDYRSEIERAAREAYNAHRGPFKTEDEAKLCEERLLRLVFAPPGENTALPYVDGIAAGMALIVNDHVQWTAGLIQRLSARAERAERIVAAVEALIPKWQRRYEREAGGFDIAGSVAATTSTCLNELNDALNTQERT